MSRKLKKRLIRIIVSSCLFIPIFIVDKVIDLSKILPISEIGWILPLSLYLIIYIIIGYDVLLKAIKNISHGQIFDENFLMIVATIGAFAIKEFPEAVAVLLLYQIGEFFQDLAVGKSRKSIAALMDIRPDYASKVIDDKVISLDPSEIKVDDVIRILPGEKIPLDGVIIKGDTSVDNKALTGESMPVDVSVNNYVISGGINISSTIDVRVTKIYEESTVNKILELVENSSNVKSKQENFITKFAKWYTPIVVISAVLLALIGSLVTLDVYTWIARALNFLVVSCPCAIVISVPLSFFASIGKAAKLGILIKGSLYLENFNKSKTYVMDKTGTLTKGNFVISEVIPSEHKDEILSIASICERDSSHPIAESIKALNLNIDNSYTLTNIPGKGILAKKDKDILLCGNTKLLDDYHISYPKLDKIGTLVYIAKNNKYVGAIVIKDEIKPEAYELISYLNKNNIKSIMLTGDNKEVAMEVASKLGVNECYYSLLPADKVNKMDEILSSKDKNDLVVYLGDGINDAPTLARSDIGVSMGALGSDAAIEASDIVLMKDDLSSLLKAKKIAKKTMTIVYENIIFALLVKLTILILSIFGLASIWLAIFGDVGVALLCVLNALRSGWIRK